MGKAKAQNSKMGKWLREESVKSRNDGIENGRHFVSHLFGI